MTRLAAPIAVIFVLAAAWSGDALAQGQRGKFSRELTTLNELHLETGPLNQPAQQCGLAAGDLETPARLAVEASRLRHIQTATDFLFVNANVLVVGDICTAAIDVELFRFSSEFGKSVNVWTRRSMIAGGKSGFNARVREKVDTLSKEFVAEWQRARQ